MTAATQHGQQQAQPGQFFDVPGIPGGATQWTEQDETTTNAVTVHQTTAAVPITGVVSFRQTDVISDWFLYLNVAQTYTPGTSTLTASAYAPMNVLGAVRIVVQNQYASVDVESGIDLYIFNLIRPRSSGEILSGVNGGANPAAGYQAAALAQVNQINAAQWTSSVTAYNLALRLPAAQWFDEYYDLAVTGEPVAQPHPALVSPQYMAGTTRVITPSIMVAAGNSATTDLGPVNIGAGTGTYAGSSTARLRRRAVYAGNPTVQPPVYAWQYRWKTQRFGMSGVTRVDIPIPLDAGQILSLYVRMFDPAAAGGIGAPININTITKVNVQYGSGLLAFDAATVGGTTAAELAQRRWFESHASLLPAGVLAFDFALDERQQMSNKRALNTLTTAGLIVHLEFASVLSSSAYAVLGTESLVYVS